MLKTQLTFIPSTDPKRRATNEDKEILHISASIWI